MPAVASSNTTVRLGVRLDACSFQKHVSSGLSGQTETVKIDTVDLDIKEFRQATGAQDVTAMTARRGDG
jgi:hypothetical protein